MSRTDVALGEAPLVTIPPIASSSLAGHPAAVVVVVDVEVDVVDGTVVVDVEVDVVDGTVDVVVEDTVVVDVVVVVVVVEVVLAKTDTSQVLGSQSEVSSFWHVADPKGEVYIHFPSTAEQSLT